MSRLGAHVGVQDAQNIIMLTKRYAQDMYLTLCPHLSLGARTPGVLDAQSMILFTKGMHTT